MHTTRSLVVDRKTLNRQSSDLFCAIIKAIFILKSKLIVLRLAWFTMKKNMNKFIILSLLWVGFQANYAHAQQAATVIDSNKINLRIEPVENFSDQGIPFLTWNDDQLMVDATQKESKVTIQGAFGEKVISATINGKMLKVDAKGNFIHKLLYTGDQRAFIITATDEAKKVWRMNYKLVGRNENRMTLKLATEEKVKISRWRYSFGAGYTLISYRDDQDIILKQNTVTMKGGVIYRAIDSVLDFGLSGFYNVIAMGSTSLGEKDVPTEKLRYLGLNARATYHLIDSAAPFKVNLSGGFYWNSSVGTLGFSNMVGPQIYPDFTYVLANGNSIYVYGKYAASISNAKSISLRDNREVAMGVHYSFPITLTNRMTVGVDVSQLTLSIQDRWASTNTYSLSTGVSF
jgi:hypothetical protein